MARVLALEPFYGGSHKAFLDGLIERSRHRFEVLSMPPCFWKWRMRGAAVKMAEQARALDFKPDLVLASDMLALPEFVALYGRPLPSIIYMHENQLSYPSPNDDHRDLHFGFSNIVSCLAATAVAWNSEFHLESFLEAVPPFIDIMPDQRPKGVAERIRQKSLVLPPGVDLDSIDRIEAERTDPPLVVWNHRWEFDKAPEVFFAAIDELDRAGLDFRLAVLGENFQARPDIFLEARERHADKIEVFGFAEDREEYLRWLGRASVSVSTAVQENFGIAAVEAAYAGGRPLWPRRLSYPGLIPASITTDHLYSDFTELVVKLKKAVMKPCRELAGGRAKDALRRFDWNNLMDDYDELIDRVAGV